MSDNKISYFHQSHLDPDDITKILDQEYRSITSMSMYTNKHIYGLGPLEYDWMLATGADMSKYYRITYLPVLVSEKGKEIFNKLHPMLKRFLKENN